MKTIATGILLVFSFINCWGQNFTPKYIAENKGKWAFEIPEVQELVHIIIAITSTGIADSNMVEHRGKYYREVLAHFGKFKDKGIVKEIDAKLKSKWTNYFYLKMDACGFSFDDNGKIVKDKTYDQLSWGWKNHINPFVAELVKFSNETGFRGFFKEHKEDYDRMIVLIQKQMPIDNQWRWLESNFPIKYDNYRITFSPLVNGAHSTNRFEAKNFKQTIMFICGPNENPKHNEKITEGLMTRVVFTEIDHNYVNPVTDKYRGQINKIFKNRSKWTSGKDAVHYGNAYSIFNEYMTWAVFTLYALDTYDEGDFKTVNESAELQMTNSRGFSRFREFNQKVIELYKRKGLNQNIADLYPAILEWCKSE